MSRGGRPLSRPIVWVSVCVMVAHSASLTTAAQKLAKVLLSSYVTEHRTVVWDPRD